MIDARGRLRRVAAQGPILASARVDRCGRHQSHGIKQNLRRAGPVSRVGATMLDDDKHRASLHRQTAERLRQIAAELRFDLCRREQLRALAKGFDRLAEKREGSPLKQAAD
jgi:uncharacterized NAD(P)/FAD-binding protein YdhS